LLFCAGALENRCGIIHDFTVTHDGAGVRLSEFYRCAVPADTVIEIPWDVWAHAVAAFGTQVLRRCTPRRRGIRAKKRASYLRYRTLLRDALGRLRAEIRARGA